MTRADANMVTHMGWIQRRTEGMQVIEADDLVLIDSGLPCDTFNFVCRARIREDVLEERVAWAIGHFENVHRPFSWWVGPADRPARLGSALIDVGLAAAESEVAMEADLHELRSIDLTPRGLRVERARSAQQILAFARLLAGLWSPPDENVVRFYQAAVPALLAPDSPIRVYVGYLDEVPVATAELTVGGGVAGLYNISTLEAHRGEGIGSAMTVLPLIDAGSDGFTTAILQAAAEGVGVYERVGFRATGRYTEYQPKNLGAE